MAKQYAAIITSKGQALIAAAIKGGSTVNITEIAVGDGNGSTPVPTVGQTALVNETARININSLTVDTGNANHVIADGVIPAETGGFWLREVGLFTDNGILLAVSALPPTYKPSAEEGATNSQRILITLIVSDASAVNITVDNTTVMASESYVDDKIAAHEKSRNHPDGTLKAKGFVQLSSATNSTSEALAATPKAVKAANDNADSRLKADKNLSDLPSVSDAKKNLELDKVGNYAAVQANGGLHNTGTHRIYLDWGADEKLHATVDETDEGELFTTVNPPTKADPSIGWWRDLSTGLIIQVGTLTNVPTGSVGQYALPVSFSSAGYSITATGGEFGTPQAIATESWLPGTFRLQTSVAQTTVHWIAIGY